MWMFDLDNGRDDPARTKDWRLATLTLSLLVADSSLSRQSFAGAEIEWRRRPTQGFKWLVSRVKYQDN